jgi:hypothetical protein
MCPKIFIHLSWKRQTFVDSAGNRTNLNYNYMIVCSWFFAKILLKYKISYFIIDLVIFLQYSTSS